MAGTARCAFAHLTDRTRPGVTASYFDRCTAGFSVGVLATLRLCAVLISAMCVSACGKFPVWRRAAVSYSSAKRPRSLAMAKRLGIATAHVAVIGDMENDLPMFARSGLSFAMGDAADEIKRHASHVTASNEDEGFARAIEVILAR